MQYRLAAHIDIPAVARIRAAEWETEEYWQARISRYLAGELHPRQALAPRVAYVAVEASSVIGFIAGHLTRRYNCDGELEWINVLAEHRGNGIASELLRLLAGWFAERNALRICVDVEPTNDIARRFYTRHGGHSLNDHWLVWNDIKVVLNKR